MPNEANAPTLDDVRAWLQRAAESWDRRADYLDNHPPRVSTAQEKADATHAAAIYRLALAALDDAERLDYVLMLLMGSPDRANLEQLARLMELVGEATDGRAAIDTARREGA